MFRKVTTSYNSQESVDRGWHILGMAKALMMRPAVDGGIWQWGFPHVAHITHSLCPQDQSSYCDRQGWSVIFHCAPCYHNIRTIVKINLWNWIFFEIMAKIFAVLLLVVCSAGALAGEKTIPLLLVYIEYTVEPTCC